MKQSKKEQIQSCFSKSATSVFESVLSLYTENETEEVKPVTPAHLLFAILREDRFQSAAEKAGVDLDAKGAAEKIKKNLSVYAGPYNEINEKCIFSMEDIENNSSISIPCTKEVSFVFGSAEDWSKKEWPTDGKVELSGLALFCWIQANDLIQYVLDIGMKQWNDIVNALMTQEKELYHLNKNPQVNLGVNKNNQLKQLPIIDYLQQLPSLSPKNCVHREKESTKLFNLMAGSETGLIVITGSAGIGKTSLVRDFVESIEEINPHYFDGVYELDMLALSAFMQNAPLDVVLSAVAKRLLTVHECPILLIDNLQVLINMAQQHGSIHPLRVLNNYVTLTQDGRQLRVIATMSEDGYKAMIAGREVEKKIHVLKVAEPSEKEAVEIINGSKNFYEDFYQVKISKHTVQDAVTLAKKYLPDKKLPSSALLLLDQTASLIQDKTTVRMDKEDLQTALIETFDVSASCFKQTEMTTLRNLSTALSKKVFGQDTAIKTLTRAVQVAKTGLRDETKPIGSFLFVGPSGVGKTELAKQLAENLGMYFQRYDMSEYAAAFTVTKLIGSPAGYVGYEEGGLLTNTVRQHPNSVILFDEVEKADPSIFKIFLQIFDYGKLTDSKGQAVDFRDTIIIMTSNAGSTEKRKGLGFGADLETAPNAETAITAVNNLLAPELRGRISSTVVFNSLNAEVCKDIARKELKSLSEKLASRKIRPAYTDETINEIVRRGYSTEYGARKIQNVINDDIKSLFVDIILNEAPSGKYEVKFENGKFSAKKQEKS